MLLAARVAGGHWPMKTGAPAAPVSPALSTPVPIAPIASIAPAGDDTAQPFGAFGIRVSCPERGQARPPAGHGALSRNAGRTAQSADRRSSPPPRGPAYPGAPAERLRCEDLGPGHRVRGRWRSRAAGRRPRAAPAPSRRLLRGRAGFRKKDAGSCVTTARGSARATEVPAQEASVPSIRSGMAVAVTAAGHLGPRRGFGRGPRSVQLLHRRGTARLLRPAPAAPAVELLRAVSAALVLRLAARRPLLAVLGPVDIGDSRG